MSRSYKLPFLTGLVILCVGIVATGWNIADAAGKEKKKPTPRSLVAPSAVLLTEDFSYTGGTALTGNGWTEHSAGSNPINVSSPGLTYAGYAGSGVGNAVTMANTGQDVSRSYTSVTSGTVYAAFLVNVATTTTTGDYFFHLMNFGTTTFRGRVFVRKDAATTNFAFGLSRTNGTPVYTGTTFTPGTTYLVVVKYEYVAGGSNDIVQLFVDPTPGATEPVSPTLTATDADVSEPAQLSGVGLRQGGSSSGSTQQVDGIRVATTWEEAVAAGTATEPDALADMNGDGRTDYVVIRPVLNGFAGVSATSDLTRQSRMSGRERMKARLARSTGESLQVGPASVPRQWWTLYNTAEYSYSSTSWGDFEADEPLVADFDGDGKDDVAVWRYGADLGDQAYFLSINSSDFTLREVAFGTLLDNPWVVADYDGDGIDDPAVYRCPPFDPGQCYFYYQGSLNNPGNLETNMPFGIGTFGDYLPVVGDYNGDGKADFCIQGEDTAQAGAGVFYTFINGSNAFTGVQWGSLFDRLVPGDFDGDGKSDYAVTRIIGNGLYWYILEQDGGMMFRQWGNEADLEAPGDYDGDGKTDIAVYRWNPNDGQFWVMPSSGSVYSLQWGAPGDYPATYFFVQ